MGFSVYTPEELVEAGLQVLYASFSETLHFLLGLSVVLMGACTVGWLLVKVLDRDQAPFIAFSPGNVKVLPLLATSFVVFAGAIQIGNTIVQFFTGQGEIPLAHVALTNMVACIGMEIAFLVVFGGFTVLALFFRGVEEEVEVARSRSRGARKE